MQGYSLFAEHVCTFSWLDGVLHYKTNEILQQGRSSLAT